MDLAQNPIKTMNIPIKTSTFTDLHYKIQFCTPLKKKSSQNPSNLHNIHGTLLAHHPLAATGIYFDIT